MSEKIKVISQFKNNSYRNFFPEVNIAAEGNYFLQFNGYTVYLPSSSVTKNKLNIFETTVLKLFSVAPFTQDILSEKLCLPADFVKIICERLQELQLVNSAGQITDAGRFFLGQKTKAACKKKISPYLVLVTRDTGEIFPKIFSRDAWESAALDDTKIFAEKSVAFRVPGIFVNQQNYNSLRLEQNFLRGLAENFNSANTNKIFLEPGTKIESAYTDSIFLHVKVILQNRRDKNFLVSDGDSLDDKFLHSYVCRQPKDILSNLQLITLRR